MNNIWISYFAFIGQMLNLCACMGIAGEMKWVVEIVGWTEGKDVVTKLGSWAISSPLVFLHLQPWIVDYQRPFLQAIPSCWGERLAWLMGRVSCLAKAAGMQSRKCWQGVGGQSCGYLCFQSLLPSSWWNYGICCPVTSVEISFSWPCCGERDVSLSAMEC